MRIKTIVFIIIIISTLIRGIVAGILQFGNDEVYYWTHAIYPALSHFDHPPMLGWVIQFFTLDLFFNSEFFIRLAAIVFGSFNTWLIYLIAKNVKNEQAGLFAVILYISSIYCFVIAGIFILPDAPQSFFWLISLYFLTMVISREISFRLQKRYLLIAGVTIGLGILSKYTSVYLWLGFGLYVLFCDRKWLKTKELYFAGIISLILMLPILIWNYQHDFVSFTYHGERVIASNTGIHWDYFFREFGGQILYNNPVVVILIFISVGHVMRKRLNFQTEYQHLILFIGIPLILTFLFVALFRSTLPHWTGLAYTTLLIFPAVYLAQKFPKSNFPWPLKLSVFLLVLVLILGVGQINYGMLNLDKSTDIENKGSADFSLDMYGWDQVKEGFENIIIDDKSDAGKAIIVQRWFPAAHLDYYVATPLGINLYALAELERIHKYAWINEKRGGIKKGMNAYYFTMSNDFNDPNNFYKDDFSNIEFVKKIPIVRNEKVVKYAFVYRLLNLKENPVLPLVGKE